MGSSNACELQTSSRPVQNAEMWKTVHAVDNITITATYLNLEAAVRH